MLSWWESSALRVLVLESAPGWAWILGWTSMSSLLLLFPDSDSFLSPRCGQIKPTMSVCLSAGQESHFIIHARQSALVTAIAETVADDLCVSVILSGSAP